MGTSPQPSLVEAFLAGAREGESDTASIEGDILAARARIPPHRAVLLRVAQGAYLFRTDVGEPAAEEFRAAVRRRLQADGLAPVALDNPAFTEVAAMVIASIRDPAWELWGVEADVARQALERRIVGEPLPEMAGSPDAAVGATLEDLVDLDRELDEIARRIADGD